MIGYDAEASELYVDRTRSGRSDFSRDFPGVQRAPLAARHGKVRLRILVDWSSVEVFADRGQTVITDQIFPAATSDGIELFADGGSATVDSLTIRPVALQLADRPRSRRSLAAQTSCSRGGRNQPPAAMNAGESTAAIGVPLSPGLRASLAPPASTPGRRAIAASALVSEGGAASLMRDVHVGRARLTPVGHQDALGLGRQVWPPGGYVGGH